MNVKQIIGIVLIILAIYLGYLGVVSLDNSGGSVEIIGVEISAQDEGKRTMGFVYLGLAIISAFGGITLIKQK